MKTVFNDALYVGDKQDIEVFRKHQNKEELYVVAFCKTAHKSYLGYSGNAAPRDENYLWVDTNYGIAYNIIDANNVNYISDEIFKHAISRILEILSFENRKVLIACDLGKSRSLALALIVFLIGIQYDYNLIGDDIYKNDLIMDWLNSYEADLGSGIAEYLQRNLKNILETYKLNENEIEESDYSE